MYRKLSVTAGISALTLLLSLVALATPKTPAKVAGTWILTLAGMQNHPETLVLTQDGALIKGTLGPNAKKGIPITGTVDGNKVSFGASRKSPDGRVMSQEYTGTVSADAMSGSVEIAIKGVKGLMSFMNMDRSVGWTAKRHK